MSCFYQAYSSVSWLFALFLLFSFIPHRVVDVDTEQTTAATKPGGLGLSISL